MTENKQIEEMAKDVCVNCMSGVCASGQCAFQYDCPLSIETIKKLYSKDYRKVRHGAWRYGKQNGITYAKCTACGLKMDTRCYGYAFCPLCSARMDGDRRVNNDEG